MKLFPHAIKYQILCYVGIQKNVRVVMSEGLQEVAKATAYEWRRTMT
jgi:hypothetical protein